MSERRTLCFTPLAMCLLLVMTSWAAAAAEPGKVVIFKGDGARGASALADGLSGRLKKAGCDVSVRDIIPSNTDTVSLKDDVDLVILCSPVRAPWAFAATLKGYLENGGKVMTLGGPFFQEMLWPYGGQWMDWEHYADHRLNQRADRISSRIICDFEQGDLKQWHRGSARPDVPVTTERAEGGAQGSEWCFHLRSPQVPEWETAAAPAMHVAFSEGQTLTTFWAKGNENTPKVAFEWTEKDGSRWYTKVNLSQQWRFFALAPKDFTFWPDNPAVGRGGSGDTFNPQNALRFTIGLAFMHGELPPKGPHEFWMDQIGVAHAETPESADPFVAGEQPQTPMMEGIAPSYKFYPVTNLASARINPLQVLFPALPDGALAAIKGTQSPFARPAGTGFGKDRPLRYVPALEALDEAGKWCGAPATFFINGPDARRGGIVFSAPINDEAVFQNETIKDWLSSVSLRMLDGLFLYEGGSQDYAAFGGETMPVGATIMNTGATARSAQVHLDIADRDGTVVYHDQWDISLEPGETKTVQGQWSVGTTGGPFKVTVTLKGEDRSLDQLEHDVRLWRPSDEKKYVVARDGDFFLDGRKWYPFGVNYMPSSGIGLEDNRLFEKWLSSAAYDPAIIERDLDDVVALGFNMISVFINHENSESRNLVDLLLRCRDKGIRVNLSLRPGTPIDFRWEEMREIIESNRLAENETVFAYDLAWEPKWEGHDKRRRHDAEWRQWIVARYGSLEAAEAKWGSEAPVEDGVVTNPLDNQIAIDGPWRAMVIDYRDFLNELLKDKYGAARELVKSVAPHQLVSFRMSMAGDPTFNPVDMTYDLAGLAEAVDIMEPEAYGRLGPWEQVKPGWFTVAYSRAVAPDLPVMWAEYGLHVWEMWQMAPGGDRLKIQARFYDDFLKMAFHSGSNGAVCWWFPGGLRLYENSDYGVLNPDRSWRPVSHVVHKWAAPFTAPRDIPKPNLWIEFDRSKYVDGIFGVYKACQEEFWNALEEGKIPGLEEAAPSKL